MIPMAYPHLAARLFNTPLLILPGKLDAIIAGLGGRLLGASLQGGSAGSAPAVGGGGPALYTSATGERRDPGYRVVDGVGVLDVFGVLAHRGGLTADSSYILGYQEIARRFQAALDDPEVKAVLLNMDSPGGEVAGAFDLAGQIHAARGRKPVRAVASDMAASAAYLIASAADQVAVTRTGYAGSVGVVMRHVDFSQALATDGIRVTHIFAGAHKVDGNPYEPLPAAVREQFQGEINGLYQMFVDAVAAHRGMDSAAVRATEAGVLRGEDAVAAGLADRVATPDEMIAELRDLARQPRALRASVRATSERKTLMNEQEASAGGEEKKPENFAQADLDRARAEGHAAGLDAGAKVERERAAAILGHAEAAGRGALAQQCVANGLSIEQAGAILAAAPKEGAAAPGNTFAAAMTALGNPAVAPGAGADGEDPQAAATRIVAMFNRTQGA